MIKVLLLVAVLAAVGAVSRVYLLRQSLAGRATVSLALLSIAFYVYGIALYGACHGEVNFATNPFACTRAHPIAFNPSAYKVGRSR